MLVTFCSLAEESRPPVEVSIQLISLAGDIEDLALWDGRQAKPITISADFLGPRLHYSGDARLRLIRLPSGDEPLTEPTVKPKGEKQPLPAPGPVVAWLDLHAGQGPRRMILLVKPEPDRNGISSIEDDNQRFPAGSLRFLNLCDFAVTLGVGEKAIRIPPKGASVVRPNVPAGRYFDTPVHTEEDQVRRLAYQLHFFYATDRRTLLFILPGEKGSGLIRLQPVEDTTQVVGGDSPHDANIKVQKAKK